MGEFVAAYPVFLIIVRDFGGAMVRFLVSSPYLFIIVINMESDIQKLFRIGNVEEIKDRIEQNSNIVNLIDNKFNWTPLYRSVL